VQSARWRWKGGDSQSALEQLDALQAIVQNNPSQQSLLNTIERLRTAINKQTKTPDQAEFVKQALDRADSLPEQNHAEATRIYEGIITLYQADKRLESFVERAREKLQRFDESAER
jgi:translation initiation factor 2B subunit (eIF-2B alpha/beta/delta family)